MNRKETIFLIGILLGLTITHTALVQGHTFDCRQPLFSENSSCSLLGKGCIKPQTKNGAIGLWQNLKSTLSDVDQPGAPENCHLDTDSTGTTAPVFQEGDNAP